MSTTYRLTGRGTRWGLKRWRRFAKDHHFQISHFNEGWAITDADGNCLHLSGGNGCLNYFDRYGGNNPEPVLEALDDEGQGWLSEYDEGFD